MALSPDLLPITASAVGIVERRWRLTGRRRRHTRHGTRRRRPVGHGHDAAPAADRSHRCRTRPVRQRPRLGTHRARSRFGPRFAVAAGVAGMLAYETAGSAAVGVAAADQDGLRRRLNGPSAPADTLRGPPATEDVVTAARGDLVATVPEGEVQLGAGARPLRRRPRPRLPASSGSTVNRSATRTIQALSVAPRSCTPPRRTASNAHG